MIKRRITSTKQLDIENKYSIIQSLIKTIVETDDILFISNLVIDMTISYTNAEKGTLMLLNENGELSIYAGRGIDEQLMRTYKIKIGENIAGTVAANRKCVLVENIENHVVFKKYKHDRYRTKSFISCPILMKNKLLGVININDKKDSTPFNDDELELVKIIANHASIALENAYLKNQLRTKAIELDELNTELMDRDTAKSDFFIQLSHEMRPPLNSIKGAIHYLQKADTLNRNEQNDFYDIISQETENLISFVENSLAFSRLEDEAKLTKKNVINISNLLRDLLESKSFQTILSNKRLQVQLKIEGNISDTVGDGIKVKQFFVNLIDGLSPYLEVDKIIGIIVTDENESIRIVIIFPQKFPNDILGYILKPFNSYYKSNAKEELKIWFARKIAEIHRWDVIAEDINNTLRIVVQIPNMAKHKISAYMDSSMTMFVDFVSEVMNLNTCSIMFVDYLTGDLTINSAKGLDDDVIRKTRIRFGDRIAGWVALEGKPLLVEDIENDQRLGRKNISRYNTKSFLSLPLKKQGQVIGVINLSDKKSVEPFTRRDLYIASVISERVSYVIEKVQSGQYDENILKNIVETLKKVVDAEKRYYKKRSLAPEIMLRMMDKYGANEDDKKLSLYVSIIYDLGITQHENILRHKKLSAAEIDSLKSHPQHTIDLIRDIEFSEDVKKAILHHHEHYNGTGYPDRLKGDQIPFLSRVLAVVDAYSSMIEKRHYRNSYTHEEALRQIKLGTGSLYDPEMVKALEEVVSESFL